MERIKSAVRGVPKLDVKRPVIYGFVLGYTLLSQYLRRSLYSGLLAQDDFRMYKGISVIAFYGAITLYLHFEKSNREKMKADPECKNAVWLLSAVLAIMAAVTLWTL